MKKLLVISLIWVVVLYPAPIAIAGDTVRKTVQTCNQIPCSFALKPASNISEEVKGVALIYKAKMKITETYTRERTGISLHAHGLPDPASVGNYDGYEGFAQIPDVISWRFRLYPTSSPDNPIWAGRFEEISADLMANTRVQVRLSNSKSNTLGPVVLENTMNACCSSK